MDKITKCKRDILKLIDSVYLRNYLVRQIDRLSVTDYMEIVMKAPVSLQKKYKLLNQIRKWKMDRKHQDWVTGCENALERALKCLNESGGKNVQFLLKEMDLKQICDAVPVISYQGALKYIYDNYLADMREKDLFPSQRKEIADFYFILERYKVIDTKCWKDYEYTLDSRGEALYFKRIKREDRKSEIYDTAFQGEGMEFIPVPYRQGDILYIDCRPFLDPTYCLIYYVGDDRECCSVRCLYPQCGDIIGEGALKHGHFYSSILSDSSANYISPLFRAELYNGILPKEYRFMEEIRIQLFRNAGLSGEMDKFFFNNIRSFYVKQSYRILGDDTCADHARIDGICKKDLMAFCVKRC